MNANAKRQIKPESGYENMASTLMDNGIHLPFIPKALRLNIIAQKEWCWSTDTVNSFQMYQMDKQYLYELITTDAPDYMALSHAGHGINSYGLQYALRYGPLVVFFQRTFGGVYNDNKKDLCCVNASFNQINDLLKTIPADITKKAYSKKIVLIWSDFRSACNYGSLDRVDLQSRGHKLDVFSDIDWQFLSDPNQLFKNVG